MPSIQLQAKLRAYTRAPFYADIIREAPKDDKQYVRLNGEWQPLDTSLLQGTLEEYKEQVVKLQKQLDAVDIEFLSTTNQLIFIDGYGNKTFVTLPGTNVDHKTIGLTDTNALYVMDTPDNKTIKIVDIETKPREDDPYYQQKVSGKLRVDAIYAENNSIYLSGQNILDRLNKAEKNISDLESYTQGTGGFLDPNNFEGSFIGVDNDIKNNILNKYAYNQLFNGVPSQIPDQTKVKNIYDGHIWVYILSENNWIDEGADTVVNANNDGVLGAVTGVRYNIEDPSTKFKISIDEGERGNSLGTMSVNGLEDEFEKVVYIEKTDSNPTPNTYVKRTIQGNVTTAESIQKEDAINRGEFIEWQSNTNVSAAEILNIVNSLYFPEIGDSDGDGDIDVDWGSDSIDNGIIYG